MLGSSNIQVTTSVMQYGYRIIDDLVAGLKIYMAEHLITRVEDMVGIALHNVVPADELDRATVVFPMFNRERCVGCGRCFVACADAGHQAIGWGADRTPKLSAKKCVGCHLCLYVCPHGAIAQGTRVPKPARLQ
jgi:dihydropyrimidine dehydrogenase (NAD+) subunit PreA